MIVLELDEVTAGHLALAVREYREALSRNGLRPTPALIEFYEVALSVARGSQRSTAVHSGSAVAELIEAVESAAMRPPQLLRFAAAAAQLSSSVSSVKRLVEAGELQAVKLGDERRIRQADLDAYVARLGEPTSFRDGIETKVAS